MRIMIAKAIPPIKSIHRLTITVQTTTIIAALSVPVPVAVQLQIRNLHLLNFKSQNPLYLQKSLTLFVIFLSFPITAEIFGNRQRLMLNTYWLMYYQCKRNAMR